jgi:IS5 family transposase
VASDKQQFIDDQRQRNAVEGKIGQGKRRFGLGLIREKLPATQGSTIALNVLVMNLEKLLELLFVLFTSWLYFLLSNQPGKGSRFLCLSTQLRPA